MADYTSCSDAELTNMICAGDRMAYAEVYQRYVFPLLNHAYNKTRDREEARDIVQEVFAILWAKRELLQITNLAGYLFKSTRNIFLNQVAHRAVQDKYLLSMEQFATSAEVSDHLARERQLMAIIEREIAALPPKMREVFELSRKEHLSHKEIAEKLGISEQTVSKQVTNALRILRPKLGALAWALLMYYS